MASRGESDRLSEIIESTRNVLSQLPTAISSTITNAMGSMNAGRIGDDGSVSMAGSQAIGGLTPITSLLNAFQGFAPKIRAYIRGIGDELDNDSRDRNKWNVHSVRSANPLNPMGEKIVQPDWGGLPQKGEGMPGWLKRAIDRQDRATEQIRAFQPTAFEPRTRRRSKTNDESADSSIGQPIGPQPSRRPTQPVDSANETTNTGTGLEATRARVAPHDIAAGLAAMARVGRSTRGLGGANGFNGSPFGSAASAAYIKPPPRWVDNTAAQSTPPPWGASAGGAGRGGSPPFGPGVTTGAGGRRRRRRGPIGPDRPSVKRRRNRSRSGSSVASIVSGFQSSFAAFAGGPVGLGLKAITGIAMKAVDTVDQMRRYAEDQVESNRRFSGMNPGIAINYSMLDRNEAFRTAKIGRANEGSITGLIKSVDEMRDSFVPLETLSGKVGDRTGIFFSQMIKEGLNNFKPAIDALNKKIDEFDPDGEITAGLARDIGRLGAGYDIGGESGRKVIDALMKAIGRKGLVDDKAEWVTDIWASSLGRIASLGPFIPPAEVAPPKRL